MKTTTNSFFVSKLTDGDLSRLIAECTMEQERREHRRREAREGWVNGYYHAFLNNPSVSAIHVGETTVLAINNHRLGPKMVTATPVRGDVFDFKTGIAVAYAKAMGERIPDYI